MNKQLFLDELSFSSCYHLLISNYEKRILTLENNDTFKRRFLKFILIFLGYKIDEVNFFAGNLKSLDGESITIASVRLSSILSFDATENLIKSKSIVSVFNPNYDIDVFRIFLSKQIYSEMYYLVLRAMVVEALTVNCKAHLIIKKPLKFETIFINKKFTEINFYYYSRFDFTFFQLISVLYTDLGLILLRFLEFKKWRKENSIINDGLPSVLTFQTDTLRSDLSLRGQPHWVDREKMNPGFRTFILSKIGKPKNRKSIMDKALDFGELKKFNVYDIPYGFSLKKYIITFLKQIIKVFSLSRLKLLFIYNSYERHSLFVLNDLNNRADFLENLIHSLNVKVILIGEPHNPYSDASTLISGKLGVKTISYQYSNLPFYSTLMTIKVDKFLLFSDLYKPIFNYGNINSKQYISTGYLFSYVKNIIVSRVELYRDKLQNKGVKFTICYFDERVDNNKWGHVKNEEHLSELLVLINLILDDKTFGLVVKSQFTKYSPSNWYSNNHLFKLALATGRYIELNEGLMYTRNDILPTEAALISDICISHKYGATAGLEAAISGKRCVLLNKDKIKSNFDNLYSKSMIEFDSIESIVYAIKQFRFGFIDFQDLGDWRNIITEFDNFQDNNSIVRFRSVIENEVLCN
jgi:hypothetical protein